MPSEGHGEDRDEKTGPDKPHPGSAQDTQRQADSAVRLIRCRPVEGGADGGHGVWLVTFPETAAGPGPGTPGAGAGMVQDSDQRPLVDLPDQVGDGARALDAVACAGIHCPADPVGHPLGAPGHGHA